VPVGVTSRIRSALSGSGIELVASCDIASYDERAPLQLRSAGWLPGARGVVVAASAGPALWRRFRARASPTAPEANPYDAFVGEILDGVDDALRAAGTRFVRFDAAFQAPVRVSFVELARLVGLGEPGPFGLLIHPEHGAWWALRGAWLVDAEVEAPLPGVHPCDGCHAPCVGGWARAGGILQATAAVRSRCIVGQASRYDADQIAFHEQAAAALTQKSPS
jgi:hypothetical protein